MIIGLTGHKGVGKDALATLLRRYGYKRRAFADAIKALAFTIGWDGSKAERGPCGQCGILQGRALPQAIGKEGVRDIVDEDAWIRALARTMLISYKASELGTLGGTVEDDYVITDVRFKNEALWIRDLGGIIVKVLRTGYEGDDHASETELEEIRPDTLVDNNSTLTDLRDEAAELVRWMKRRASRQTEPRDPSPKVPAPEARLPLTGNEVKNYTVRALIHEFNEGLISLQTLLQRLETL